MWISADDLAAVSHTITWLSIVGSLLLISLLAAYHVSRKSNAKESTKCWNPTQREMLLWLSVCDLVQCIFYLIRPGVRNHNCAWVAPVITFFNCAGYLWTAAIALDVWRTVKFRHSQPQTNPWCISFSAWSRIVCFGIPAVLTAFQLYFKVSGVDEEWGDSCWIKHMPTFWSDLWRFESGKTTTKTRQRKAYNLTKYRVA